MMSAGTAPRTDQETVREVAFFDLYDLAFQPDAPEVLDAREACWYARTLLGYAVLRYDEVVALLRDRRLRQGGVESLAAQGITAGPLADWMRMAILNIEGEQHASRPLPLTALPQPSVADRGEAKGGERSSRVTPNISLNN